MASLGDADDDDICLNLGELTSLTELEALDDVNSLELLRDLNQHALVVNTNGPFYRGALGEGDACMEAMHVVMGETRDMKMVRDIEELAMQGRASCSFFVVDDDVYGKLPPVMASGALLQQLLSSHIVPSQQKAFTNSMMRTLSLHTHSILCTNTDVIVGNARVIDAFISGTHDVYVLDALMPFMWIDPKESLRLHQVHNRMIRPGSTVHIMGARRCDYVSLTITDDDVYDEVRDGIEKSHLELVEESVNIYACNLALCRITHKPVHSGFKMKESRKGDDVLYRHTTCLNMCLREKATDFEISRFSHRFCLHNSGHTLPAGEIIWRANSQTSRLHAQRVDVNTKQTMTTHHYANPPLPRQCGVLEVAGAPRKRKKQRRADPPPVCCVVAPKSMHTATHRASPVSPMDLHRASRVDVCGDVCRVCEQPIDEEEDMPRCDWCDATFHLRCTKLVDRVDEVKDDDLCFCQECRSQDAIANVLDVAWAL